MNKKFAFLSLVVAIAMILGACAPAKSTEKTSEVITIGYDSPELTGGQGAIMGGMVAGAKLKDWAVVTSNANSDAATQANQIDTFIQMGVKAIVAVPVDSKAVCASIEKAKDAGIPFFTIDRAPDGCAVDMTIQSDNYLAGKQAAEAMVALLVEKYGSEKGTVLELQGDLGQNVAQLRGGGFNDVMKKYPEITVIQKPTNWDAAKFSSATLDVASSEELDGIYMHSDCVGIKAVSAALEQVNKLHKTGEEGHIILTGVDGCRDMLQAIRDGYADESSSQPLPDFGVVIADFMEQVLSDQALKAGTVEKDGALWSPAVIEQTSTGFVANLSTTQVTSENVDNPGLWGNQ